MSDSQRYFYADDWRTLTEIARITEVSRAVLYARMGRGMTLEEAISFQPRQPQRLTFAGKSLTYSEWAKETGINLLTLRDRIEYHGWPIERALTEPAMTNAERAAFNRREASQ